MTENTEYEAGNSDIKFNVGNPPRPMMILTEKGFIYKGQQIDDAGEAWKLFTAWIKGATVENT